MGTEKYIDAHCEKRLAERTDPKYLRLLATLNTDKRTQQVLAEAADKIEELEVERQQLRDTLHKLAALIMEATDDCAEEWKNKC